MPSEVALIDGPPPLRSYQERAAAVLSLDSGTDARGRLILLDMGMGKTAATLTAIARDPDMQPALILAPPRVARMTWPVEAAMWAPALRCGVAGGGPKQRAEVLHDPNLDLVCLSIRSAKDAIGARRWRTVVVDESTTVRTPSTKAHAAVRTLMRPQAGVRRLALLTGTPAPNCLSDLYGQVRLADSGERLGKSIASFRERWMYAADRLPSGVVTKWLERPGARDDVLDRIRDISLCVSYDDPAAPDLPERLDVPIDVELPTKAQLLYRRMEREGAIALREGVATAATAAAVSSRLSQITAGVVYEDPDLLDDGSGPARPYQVVHTDRLDAVVEAVEQAASPTLVLYRFVAEREELRKRLPGAVGADEPELVDRWNAGDIPAILAHPLSLGHGLNLQKGPGHTIVWSSLPWSWEQWSQANRRLVRPGQSSAVTVAVARCPGTIDVNVEAALRGHQNLADAVVRALTEDN